MQQPNNLDFVALEPVNKDKRCATDHQLTGAFLAPCAAHFGMLHEHAYLLLNLLVLTDRRQWVVPGYVVQLLKSGCAGNG